MMIDRTTKAKAMRVKIEEGKTGLFYATSPDLKGLLVAEPTIDALEEAIPKVITDMMYAARGGQGWPDRPHPGAPPMSWLSTLLPSLATIATTNPTLATDIINQMGGAKKAAANAVGAQLHSLTMGVLANATKGLQNVGNTVTSILGIPHFADLNISDQVNLLNTAQDAASLLKMITDVETAIKPDLA